MLAIVLQVFCVRTQLEIPGWAHAYLCIHTGANGFAVKEMRAVGQADAQDTIIFQLKSSGKEIYSQILNSKIQKLNYILDNLLEIK